MTIECIIVSGRPEPTISWYRNGKLFEDKTGQYFLNNQEIEENDAGSYKCVGKSDVGSDESSEIRVAVHQKRGGEDRGNGNNNAKILFTII